MLVPHVRPLHLEGLQVDPRRAVDERPRRRLALRDEDRVEVPLAAVLVRDAPLRSCPCHAAQSAVARPKFARFLRLWRASSGPRPTTKTHSQTHKITATRDGAPRFFMPAGYCTQGAVQKSSIAIFILPHYFSKPKDGHGARIARLLETHFRDKKLREKFLLLTPLKVSLVAL